MTDLPARKLRRWRLLAPLSALLGCTFCAAICAEAQSASEQVSAALGAGVPPARILPATASLIREAGVSAPEMIPEAPLPNDPEGVLAPELRSPESRSIDFEDLGSEGAGGTVLSAKAPGSVSTDQCPEDATHAKSCRVHWHQLLISTAVFNAFQNSGNVYTGYWYRWETTHGNWYHRWIDSAAGWRWDTWNDQNPFLDVYVGHPMMGSITNYLWIQNDPKGMPLEIANSRAYWKSRLSATAFSTAYSFEWKLGPFGEAGIGHIGYQIVPRASVPPSKWTNDTGWAELVTTPVGGLLWTMAEDAMDKYIVKKVEARPRGPLPLLLVSFLTPARATANIFRFRAPWYRDGRAVPVSSFWSEPGGEGKAGTKESVELPTREEAVSSTKREGRQLPEWPHYGGVHEFGAWWGISPVTGHIWGYASDVKYMPVAVSYSYLLYPGSRWNFRYSPELTALAMLDEVNPAATNRFNQRKRTYGSGVSPLGFRASFYPESRVQPFVSTDGGFIYFTDRVLSPQGSQFMYTIDYGGGIQIFRKARQSVSIGYRYQHLSNANISHHNPGTDANTFYVAISRFRSKHYR